MHFYHIPQYTNQNKDSHISVLNDLSWGMGQGYCEIFTMRTFGFQKLIFERQSFIAARSESPMIDDSFHLERPAQTCPDLPGCAGFPGLPGLNGEMGQSGYPGRTGVPGLPGQSGYHCSLTTRRGEPVRIYDMNDDTIAWKRFPHHRRFVRAIHRWLYS